MNLVIKIRNYQTNKGYEPCFATGKSGTCGEGECSHRPDCKFQDLRSLKQHEYMGSLFGHITDQSKKDAAITKAFETALAIRAFEIELYWKRAAYFWVFITASFAGFYWAVQQAPSEKVDNILLITASMGLCTSWAWCLVLKGSKYWQENWEHHVDFLEDNVVGMLYKHVKSGSELNGKDLLSAYPFSVSKVNSLLGSFLFIIWTFIYIYVLLYLCGPRLGDSTSPSWFLRIFFVGMSVAFISSSFWECETKNASDIMASDDSFYCRKFSNNYVRNEDKEIIKGLLLLLLFIIMILLVALQLAGA